MIVEVFSIGLLQARICCTKDCTDSYIEKEANRQAPTGIHSPWHIRHHIEPVYAQCHDHADRHHVIVEC